MENKKRLYKSTTSKKISGVCGGVAEYLDLDPTIVRIVWALVSLLWGTGIILYIIAALVMDENPDASAGFQTAGKAAYSGHDNVNHSHSADPFDNSDAVESVYESIRNEEADDSETE